MAKKILPLYVSSRSWVAPSVSGELLPGNGDHSEAPDWSQVGKELREKSGVSQVQVLLSARLCRYQVLPWLSSCYTASAIRAYVADAFAEVASVTADTHHVAIDWPAYGEPILAVAYPRIAIEALHSGMVSAGHRPAGVDSSVGPILRRYGRKLGSRPALLAYAEDDGITGITLEEGRVVQVETLSGQDGGLEDIGIWSSRKQFAFGHDAQLHWLGTAARPASFAGAVMVVLGPAPSSAGHGVVSAWR